ncbi:restriction endonuclease subunit S [Acinetobacter nosocomialis]|uniref:restriction endonuclease subunit S n=1 Tax=Acinetobacter nosocomialis TaxID=106654 RepID=UPI0012502D52|nr:restriction endonuclease subunit S [Acinetobacter nosocomialis]
MAKYQSYAEYKDSGVEWLGNVPQHWALVPCRAVVDHIVEKNSNNALDNYLSLMANIGVIKYEDKGDVGNKKPDDLSKCKIVRKGQLVINSMNYAIGSYGMSPYDGICSPVYIVLQAKKDVFLERFALRIFENTPFQKYLATFGNGILEHRAAINWEDIKNKYVPLPTLDEQKNILDFLDHETSKIDRLIEKQQQLIELLKEKRQAVISHAVTKGLYPNVPMKDSGVEWLGEVPEHWVVKSYRLASRIYRGKFGHRPRNDPAFYDGDYPFIQTGDVARAGKYITSYSQTLNEKGKEVSQLFPKGTLMMAIAANIGDIAILGFEAYAPDSVVGFKPNNDIDLEFLRYSFIAALPALEQTSTQSTQANLNVERIGAVKGTFPSLQEQREIVGYLDNLLEQYRNLVKIAENAISLMQERRTALISAAVTGKIDVRHWQAPTVAEADTEFSA